MKDELGFIFYSEINRLAATFYQMNGRKFMPDHEFSASTHPEEVDCWNKAIIAFAYINKDNDLIKYQVKASDNITALWNQDNTNKE